MLARHAILKRAFSVARAKVKLPSALSQDRECTDNQQSLPSAPKIGRRRQLFDMSTTAHAFPRPVAAPEMATLSTVGAKSLFNTYFSLTKPRLSALVLLTTMSGYAMAPQTCSLPPSLLLSTSIGTFLCIASANTFNQLAEIAHDRAMTRTRTRALCRKRYPLDPHKAWLFGSACGLVGGATLMTMVNPMTAFLGVANILLYAGMYTSMKRTSVWNTQIGSIVGGIPPVMGYVAVTNEMTMTAGLLGFLLYAWQFPHFNALSYSIRSEYKRAGYQMMSFVNPRRNALESVLGSLGLFAGSLGLVYTGAVSECFLLGSSVVNGWMLWESMRFYRLFKDDPGVDSRDETHQQQREKSAKKLFHATLFQLPALILLMLLHNHWPRSQVRLEHLDEVVHSPFGVHATQDEK